MSLFLDRDLEVASRVAKADRVKSRLPLDLDLVTCGPYIYQYLPVSCSSRV